MEKKDICVRENEDGSLSAWNEGNGGVGGGRCSLRLVVIYSTVQKGHRRNSEEANGDNYFFHQNQIKWSLNGKLSPKLDVLPYPRQIVGQIYLRTRPVKTHFKTLFTQNSLAWN